MNNVLNSLRFAEDYCNAVDCILSQNNIQVYLIAVTNDVVNFDDTGSGRSSTKSRLTIADGYRSYAPLDGYLNPRVEQTQSVNMVLANGQMTDMTVLIGSLVFPYTVGNISGGIDPITFQPALISPNINLQVYLQILGLGLAPNGNFFKIKEIMLTGKGIQEGISYKLVAESISENVLL